MSIIDNDVKPQQLTSEPEIANTLLINSENNNSNKETIVSITETDINDTIRPIINTNESALIESSRVEDNKEQNTVSPPTTNKRSDKIICISHINMDVVNNQLQHLQSQMDVNTTTVATTEANMKNETPKPKRKKRNKFYNPQPYKSKSFYPVQILKYILLYVLVLTFIVVIILLIIKLG